MTGNFPLITFICSADIRRDPSARVQEEGGGWRGRHPVRSPPLYFAVAFPTRGSVSLRTIHPVPAHPRSSCNLLFLLLKSQLSQRHHRKGRISPTNCEGLNLAPVTMVATVLPLNLETGLTTGPNSRHDSENSVPETHGVCLGSEPRMGGERTRFTETTCGSSWKNLLHRRQEQQESTQGPEITVPPFKGGGRTSCPLRSQDV